jgi:hypothetical protein
MKSLGWGLALLSTLALLAPAVTAGTEASPEITDPKGDAVICVQAPACTPSQDDLDIIKGWVDTPDADHVAFHLELVAAPTVIGVGAGTTLPMVGCLPTTVSKEYQFHFTTLNPQGNPLVAGDPNNKGAALTGLFVDAQVACDTVAAGAENALGFYLVTESAGTAGTNIASQPVDGTLAGTVLTWTLPRSNPAILLPAGAAATGYQVGNLFAADFVTFSVASAGLTNPPAAPDRAPNSGFGSVFVLGGSTLAKPIYSDVTTPAFTLAAKNPTKTNQTYIYNWTNANADVDLAYGAVASSGTAHVVVKDSMNMTVLDKTFPAAANGTQELKSAMTGKWQVTVAYANFTGALALSIAQHQAGSTATPSASSSSSTSAPPGPSSSSSASSSVSSSTPASGSGTLSSSSTKGSPALGLGVLLAALGAVAVAVRRRL